MNFFIFIILFSNLLTSQVLQFRVFSYCEGDVKMRHKKEEKRGRNKKKDIVLNFKLPPCVTYFFII
jgi:hypothetical protein